jgi:putative adenylate-forming enzyme
VTSIDEARGRAALLARFVRARWGYRFRSRSALERWQRRRVARHLRTYGPRAPFYAPLMGRGARFHRLPIVDKAATLQRFDQLNTRGVRLTDALTAAREAERTRDFAPQLDGDLTVGLSSGTTGRPGVFLVSPDERMRWAGTILARVLDAAAVRRLVTPFARPLEVRFFLRAGGPLYESVGSSRVRFTFHDLLDPFDDHVASLAAESGQVDVLVAPASVLVALARRRLAGELPGRFRQLVSVAEVLDRDDRRLVERAFGVAVGEVYQATEGLLAVTCPRGSLHLNEESVLVEREPRGAGRIVPVVTDFDRTTQLVVRHRLDDVLRLSTLPCACGRVTAVVEAVEGREDDVLRLAGRTGLVDVFPDTVRRAMAMSGAAWGDWRIRQHGATVTLALRDGTDDEGVRSSLAEALETLGAIRPEVRLVDWPEEDPAAKVRRVARVDA